MPRGKARDLAGEQFGRLVVKRLAESNGRRGRWWICACECGNFKTVRGDNLTRGNTRSCGCYAKDMHIGKGNKRAGRRRKYGSPADFKSKQEHPREADAWRRMIAACEWPSSRQYKGVGGKGIKVCSEWLDSFRAFLADVGARPSPAHVLVRLDRSRDFTPANVRWGGRSEIHGAVAQDAQEADETAARTPAPLPRPASPEGRHAPLSEDAITRAMADF